MRLTAALQLARTAAPACADGDAELLRRFCRDRDEAAFREILRRYEALVRGASRRLTHDPHAIDDAVQTTFLTLARKAATIRHAAALPSWLYRVARSVTARPRAVAPIAVEPVDTVPSPLDQLSAREALAVFDEELARLPDDHRSAVLLCTVGGETVEDAARQLGTTPGAVRGWLQRGRERLRQRLDARGVGLSVALSLLALDAPRALAWPTREAVVRTAVTVRPAPAVRLLALPMVGVLAAGVISAVLLAPGAGQPQPEPPAAAKPAAEALVTRDNLPEGAVARIGSPRLRHAEEVAAIAFSPDGKFLATVAPGNRDKSVRVWDLSDGTEKHRIPVSVNKHESSVRHRAVAVQFTPDSKRLIVLDAREFRSFDITTGRRELATDYSKKSDPNQFFPREGVIGTGISPDSKRFAIVRGTGEMLLGDAVTGAITRTIPNALKVPENTSYSVVPVLFTPNGSEVCIPVSGGPVPLFDVTTGESKRSLHKDVIPDHGVSGNAAFGADGKTFITSVGQRGGPNPVITVADIETGKSLRTIPVPMWANLLSLSPDGKRLAVASGDVKVLDFESGKEIQSVPVTLSPALVAFSPDSRLLAATCAHDGSVTVWDTAKNAPHPQSADDIITWASFDRRGHVQVIRNKRTLSIDWRTGKVVDDKPLEWWGAGPLARSEDRTLSAELDRAKGKPYAIVVKAAEKVVGRLEGVTDYPTRTLFADKNKLLVTACQDNTLTVWDIATGKPLWVEKYPARSFGYRGMGDPQFDAANRRLVLCVKAERGTYIDVWDVRKGGRMSRVEVPKVLLTGGVAFSPDGAHLAGGAQDVTVWRVSDGREVHKLGGHSVPDSPNERPSVSCEFSADGRKLLTVDGAGTIRVWEVATGQVVRTFAGHHGSTTAAFSPDARAVAGASRDAPVFIWDVYRLPAPPRFDAERVWAELADGTPATAFRAVRELCASPKEALALLAAKVPPDAIDRKAVAGWVADLSAEEFADREKATAALEKQGETIAPLLRDTLGATTDAETRRRLAALVAKAERPTPASLRLQRAMDALEHLGTAEANAHLEALARGAAGGLRTVQATEALSRINGR